MKAQYRIEKTSFPLDGQYNYSAEVDLSTDEGKHYYHCGIGKYTRTFEEAVEYCKQYETEHEHDGDSLIYVKNEDGTYSTIAE